MNPSDLAGLRFSLVGPGRVGASLARWAVAAGARFVQVAGRDEGDSPARLASVLGGRREGLDRLATENEDFLLVAAPDRELDRVAEDLARLRQAPVVWHTSGARDASALAALRRRGSAVGSLHPLRAFPAVLETPAAGTFYAVDGDPAAVALARRVVAACGGSCAEVPADARRLYHLGAWMSAGGVATLLAAAGALVRPLRLPDEVALGYRKLAVGAIEALGDDPDPGARITGPVARGDVELVLGQIADLTRIEPEMAPLVRRLALETLRQIERTRPLDERQTALREALGEGFIP